MSTAPAGSKVVSCEEPFVIIVGELMLGKVDRVPGVCYVVTKFAHLNFVIMIPSHSYIVIEGTDGSSAFRGKEIPVDLKSMVVAYARLWGGIAAVLFGAIAWVGLEWTKAHPGPPATAMLFGAGVAGFLVLFIGGKIGATLQLCAHLLSLILWYAFRNAAGPNVKLSDDADGYLVVLLLANLALLLYGLTRFCDRASPARARELLHQLGAEAPRGDRGVEEPQQGAGWELYDEREDPPIR